MEVNSDELMGYQVTARKSRNGIAENWSFYEERASSARLFNPRRLREKKWCTAEILCRHSKTAEREKVRGQTDHKCHSLKIIYYRILFIRSSTAD